MIHHVVLLTFVPEATDQRAAVLDGLLALPARIPEISAYAVGHDLGLSPDTASLGIVAEFATQADWEVYRDHPEHRRVITELIGPIHAGRAAVQFER